MIPEPPEYDPKTVWQNQTALAGPLLEELQRRSQRLKAKNRRALSIFSVAILLYTAVSIAEDVAFDDPNIWWVGAIRFALLIVWVYYLPVGVLGTNYLSPLSLRTAALTPVFDFYRAQLVRRRDYFQDGYRTALQWAFLSAAALLYSISYPAIFPVFGTSLVVFAAILYNRKRLELPHLRRELETLSRFQKD